MPCKFPFHAKNAKIIEERSADYANRTYRKIGLIERAEQMQGLALISLCALRETFCHYITGTSSKLAIVRAAF